MAVCEWVTFNGYWADDDRFVVVRFGGGAVVLNRFGRVGRTYLSDDLSMITFPSVRSPQLLKKKKKW